MDVITKELINWTSKERNLKEFKSAIGQRKKAI